MDTLPQKRNYLLIATAIGLFIVLRLSLPFAPPVVSGLSILAVVALLWLTEAIPVCITALLVPLLAISFGIFDTRTALSYFADPVIFLFLGGFALAAALGAQGLDRALARHLLRVARGNFRIAVLLLFVAAAALSMWISNTATTAMMLPLVLGILRPLDPQRYRNTYAFALLGIAYCSSIGGIATVVGSPPNAIAAAQSQLDFLGWLQMALPLSLILLVTAISLLFVVLKPEFNVSFATEQPVLQWQPRHYLTLGIFILTAISWIFSGLLDQWAGGITKPDSVIALSAIVLLCGSRVVSWRDIESTTDWGVLLLFGGGLCLSAVLRETGTSLFFADSLNHLLAQASVLQVLLVIVAFVVILTEFTSNTASAALLVPVFASVAPALGIAPVVIAAVVGISASCAFMLPVATPPNAIVFASGFVPQQTMLRCGLWINLFCIFVITAYALLFWVN